MIDIKVKEGISHKSRYQELKEEYEAWFLRFADFQEFEQPLAVRLQELKQMKDISLTLAKIYDELREGKT